MNIFTDLTREQRRSKDFRRKVAEENASWSKQLVKIPEATWQANPGRSSNLIEVWRSRDFLVQVFREGSDMVRLSFNRTTLNSSASRWEEGITWEEMQKIKHDCGYGDLDAVEVFPRDCDVVNVANMRHLWVFFKSPLFFARRKS